MRKLAACLREHPTVPGDRETGTVPDPRVWDDNLAVLLPPKHCAFRGCRWCLPWVEDTSERARESALIEHIKEAHWPALRPACRLLPLVHSESDRVLAAYTEAIATKVRDGAPLASYSIDRRCLRKAAEATKGDNVQSLICFMCACTLPHLKQEGR